MTQRKSSEGFGERLPNVGIRKDRETVDRKYAEDKMKMCTGGQRECRAKVCQGQNVHSWNVVTAEPLDESLECLVECFLWETLG